MIIHLEKYLVLPKKDSMEGKADITSTSIPPTLEMAMRSAWIQVAAISYMQARGTQFLPFEERYSLLDVLFSKSQETSQFYQEKDFFDILRSKLGNLPGDFFNLLNVSASGHENLKTLTDQFFNFLNGEEQTPSTQIIEHPIPPYHFKNGWQETVELSILQRSQGETIVNKEVKEKDVLPDNISTIVYLNSGKIVAVNDAATVDEDQVVVIPVKINDVDLIGGATIGSISQPSHGTIINNGNGTISYEPDKGFVGTDTFTYTLVEGSLQSTATVTVTVIGRLSEAVNDSIIIPENIPVFIPVLSNDKGDELSISQFSQASHGIITQEGDTLVYTPDEGFTGTDTFTYTTQDSHGSQSTAQVTIQVVGTVQAVNDSATTTENQVIVIPVKDNDRDPGGDALVTISSNAAHGVGTVNEDNTISYSPNLDFTGTDTFTYTLTEDGRTSTATVTVTVMPPVVQAVNDSIIIQENIPVLIPILNNDKGEGIHITDISQPMYGTVIINPDETVSYTPVHDFVGTDHFNYTITDAGGIFSTAQVTIQVAQTNDTHTIITESISSNSSTFLPASIADNSPIMQARDVHMYEDRSKFNEHEIFRATLFGQEEGKKGDIPIDISPAISQNAALSKAENMHPDIGTGHDGSKHGLLNSHEGRGVEGENISGHLDHVLTPLTDNGIIIHPITP